MFLNMKSAFTLTTTDPRDVTDHHLSRGMAIYEQEYGGLFLAFAVRRGSGSSQSLDLSVWDAPASSISYREENICSSETSRVICRLASRAGSTSTVGWVYGHYVSTYRKRFTKYCVGGRYDVNRHPGRRYPHRKTVNNDAGHSDRL